MNKQQMQCGSVAVAGTPVAITVTPGFQPQYVEIYNITQSKRYEFFAPVADEGTAMTAANAVQTLASGAVSLITANGITLTSNGFVIGTAIAAVAADVLYWRAHR